jgi:hypothetical protein
MQVRKTVSIASFTLALLACAPGQAQESPPTPQVSLGLKLWNASWLSYLPASYLAAGPNGQIVAADVINSVEGGRRTSALPQLAVRYGKLFASASYGRFTSDFAVLNSPVATPAGTQVTSRTDHFVRRESDLTLGYFVLPEVAVTAGYKYAIESRDVRSPASAPSQPLLENRARGALLGLVGNFQVTGALSAYVQAGYGPARIRTRTVDNGGYQIDAHGSYLISEIGLSYPLVINQYGMRAAAAAIGYRSQTVKTESTGVIYHENRRLRDVRDGLVLSLNVAL